MNERVERWLLGAVYTVAVLIIVVALAVPMARHFQRANEAFKQFEVMIKAAERVEHRQPDWRPQRTDRRSP